MKKTSQNSTRRIVFIAVPPIAELDLVGPWSIFQDANFVQTGETPYKLELFVSAETTKIQGDFGLTLIAENKLSNLKGSIDTVVIIGGSGVLEVNEESETVIWLKQNNDKIRRIVSVCSGAFALASAGLLDNRRATTHWRGCEVLAKNFPSIKVENGPIFVCDGNIYTSAGVTAGIDLALELVEEDLGGEVALELARNCVVFLRRPGGQAQFSVSLIAQTAERKVLRDLQTWIVENLRETLSVRQMASQVAMSERNFARVFTAEFGITPARYVILQRVEAVRRELEQSKRNQKEIAIRYGFKTADNLRRIFARELGISPEKYRSRFSRRQNKRHLNPT